MSAFDITLRTVAEALKGSRPERPASTTDTPRIQVWRQWHADVLAVKESLCENETERSQFDRSAGVES